MLEGWNESAWVRELKLKCYDGQIEKAWGQGRQRRVLLAEYLTRREKAETRMGRRVTRIGCKGKK